MSSESKRPPIVVAFLDKTYPPDHSFVRGMLAGSYPDTSGCRVLLVTERQEDEPRVTRYGRAICLTTLPERRGVGRLLGALYTLLLIACLRRRWLGRQIAVFVRNDPLRLLAAVVAAGSSEPVCFQSSFPHEWEGTWTPKYLGARLLLHLAVPRADSVLAVSNLEAKRLQRYRGDEGNSVLVIPLAPDEEFLALERMRVQVSDSLHLLYLGTHAASRRVQLFYRAASRARDRGVPLMIRSIGASESDYHRLCSMKWIDDMVSSGRLDLSLSIPRKCVRKHLAWADVGVSLYPPQRIFMGVSPTKLAEYLAAGVPVLGNEEIPYQRKVLTQSQAGVLVRYSVQSVADGIEELWRQKEEIPRLRENARRYARRHSYRAYVKRLDGALWNRPECPT